MHLRRWLAAVAVLGVVFTFCHRPAQAWQVQDQPRIQGKNVQALRFKAFDGAGVPFFVEQRSTTSQVMTTDGVEVKQEQNQTFLVRWTPKEKDRQGNWVIGEKIVGIRMQIAVGTTKISYDSTKQGNAGPLSAFFGALLDQEMTYVIKPDLTVHAVQGRQELVKKLIAAHPQQEALMKTILSEQAVKTNVANAWMAFPPDGVFPKKGWNKVSLLDLGAIGSYTRSIGFEYKGILLGKDRIAFQTGLTYQAPPEDAKGLPFNIRDSQLSGGGSGEAIFDRKLGRFESTRMTTKISGNVRVEIGGNVHNVQLNQTQETSTTTTSKHPWDGK